MEKKRRMEFLTVVLFLGILLSFLIYVGLGTMIGEPVEADERGLFTAEFYGDTWLRSVTRYVDYYVFHHTDAEHVLLGRENWIFDTYDEEKDYDYLLDYVGGTPFSDGEMAAIANRIAAEKRYYAERDMTYLVVVVPSSMTVCREYLPDYLGEQSENTRLGMLSAYLADEDAFVNATTVLKKDAEEQAPYNSTEDSLNAYGAFSVYNLIMSRLNDRPGVPYERIKRETLGFSVHMTEGRAAAQRAGLSGIVQNRTVSLIDETVADRFEVVSTRDGRLITQWRERSDPHGGTLLLEVSSDWDRTQMVPYFSNSFDTVVYVERNSASLPKAASVYAPDVVLRIVHENELHRLLD